MPSPVNRLVSDADLLGTFVFALEGALAALAAGLDPIGLLTLSGATALGGGVIRDLLIGSSPPAALRDWQYTAVVVVASFLAWGLHPHGTALPGSLLALDAAGLALFAVVGTEKSIDHGIHPLPAMFLGTISGVGGGTLRDLLLGQVPQVLYADVYASAALLAALIVTIGRTRAWPPRPVAVVAGLACFALRVAAATYHWQLPKTL